MTRQEFLAAAAAVIATYRPSQAVKDQLALVTLVAFVGPSGVGKSTLMRASGLPIVLSDVTRKPRLSERDGVDYYFRTDYDELLAELKRGDFVQAVLGIGGEFYGTRASSYPPSGAAAMAVLASVVPTMRRLGFKEVLSLYLATPSYSEWQQRYEAHGPEYIDARPKRFKEAAESLKMALNDPTYRYILADELVHSTVDLRAIIDNKPPVLRERQAHHCATVMLDELRKEFPEIDQQ